MPNFVQEQPPVAFILSEAEGQRSRENGIVAAGAGKVPPGTVVGGAATALSPSNLVVSMHTTSGSTAVDGITPTDGLVSGGVYAVTTNAGVPAAATMTYNGGGLGTLSANATATATDTSTTLRRSTTEFTGITMYGVDATTIAQPVSYIARDAEVNKKAIHYGAGLDTVTIAGLLALGIVVRD